MNRSGDSLGQCRCEHGESLEVMKAIKRALDPENRMNPGKMLQM